MPRRNQSQTSNLPINTTNSIPSINFTYSENFNKTMELNTENYPSWKTTMLHFLDMNDLIDYILTEKVRKFKINKIENLNNYTIDKINPSLAYHKDIDSNTVKLDNITKWIILNSIGDATKKLIETRAKNAFESWKILENSFTKGKEQLHAE